MQLTEAELKKLSECKRKHRTLATMMVCSSCRLLLKAAQA